MGLIAVVYILLTTLHVTELWQILNQVDQGRSQKFAKGGQNRGLVPFPSSPLSSFPFSFPPIPSLPFHFLPYLLSTPLSSPSFPSP